ncbi:MAG: MGMT family protein [Elusimicrobia bacterium]|nr:MGMT family protein [Elusimicrobiota bacterium]MBU2614503.1 MGMT family protein [Elusimicrobiota bacterium]
MNKLKSYPEFYQKVWLACLKIPKGQTRAYKWIAETIGKPKAYRAVGTALSNTGIHIHIRFLPTKVLDELTLNTLNGRIKICQI